MKHFERRIFRFAFECEGERTAQYTEQVSDAELVVEAEDRALERLYLDYPDAENVESI